jgi:hypothetical protein
VLNLKALRSTPWRWLCVECDAEGRGRHPDVCPQCGADDCWYSTDTAGDDPRPMRDVFDGFMSLILGLRRPDRLH